MEVLRLEKMNVLSERRTERGVMKRDVRNWGRSLAKLRMFGASM